MSLDYLSQLSTDAKSLAAAVGHGPADAPIAGCPGWTLQQLGVHVGNVHRWARLAVMTGAPPQIDPSADPAPEDAAGLAGWIVEGAGRLIETLRGIDPTSPTWHPFPVEPKVSGLWPRRQAQETSVHRVDAEVAIGRPAYIDAAVAADGVDEYW
ncbi:MAG: maleylpyruvate isomerase family mycothiol-dependent enzyme, partial [Actinomycetota bacterium]